MALTHQARRSPGRGWPPPVTGAHHSVSSVTWKPPAEITLFCLPVPPSHEGVGGALSSHPTPARSPRAQSWIAERAPSEVSCGLLAQASQEGPQPWSSGRPGQVGPLEEQGAVLGASPGPRQPPTPTPKVTGREESGLQMEKEDGASQGSLDEDEIPAPWDPGPRSGQPCHPTSSPPTPPPLCASHPGLGWGMVQGKGSHRQK